MIIEIFIDIDCLVGISYGRDLVGLNLLIGNFWVREEEIIVYEKDENVIIFYSLG